MACAPTKPLTPADVQSRVDEDIKKVYQQDDISGALTVEEALARGLRNNLDLRVAEMDELISREDVTLAMLQALPSMSMKGQRIGRSNPGGSSSFSLLTNTQSLQPSISQDQYRNLYQLNAEYNFLESGLAIGRSRNASDQQLVAAERRRKVYQSVVQDTYSAFWRAAVAQETLPIIQNLLAETEKQRANLDEQRRLGIVVQGQVQQAKTDLQARRQQLIGLQQSMALAQTELKTLIDYPLSKSLVLDLGGRSWQGDDSLPKIAGKIEDYERTALYNRPEVREEILKKRISVRDIKLTILETIPGFELLVTQNYDENSFLSYHKWTDGIATISASINKLITLPARHNRAEKSDLLADKRREALLAAVITQVHVARARYDFLSLLYNENLQAAGNAEANLKRAINLKDTGMMSGAEQLNIKIDSQVALTNRAFAYADAQDAYGRFINTMGVDLWEAGDANLSLPDHAAAIRRKLDDVDRLSTPPAPVKAAPPVAEKAGVKT